MSDVEKAISGLVEDEELLQRQQQKQQQQHKQTSTPLNKTNTGNTTLLQKQNHHLQHNSLLPQDFTNSNVITNTARTSSSYLTTQQYNCLSRLAKLIFSTPGLVIMVVVYTIMGAFIFPLLEAPQDISKSAIIAKSREECLKELWIITEKLNVLYERNWTILVHEQLRRFEGTIVAATRNMAANGGVTATSSTTSGATTAGGYAGMSTDTTSTTTTALSRYGNNNLAEYSDLTATRWSFSEALLYSVTVITTIGHGSLTPRTAGGKIATIFYALIGVPLMLMCLSSLGALLAEALQCTYARVCCRWSQYEVNGGNGLDEKMLSSKHKNTHIKKRQQKPLANANISRDIMVLESQEAHHHDEIKQSLHQCDFQDQPNSINCKNCKYDAIIGETNTNDGYDYQQCNDATTTATSLSVAALSSSALCGAAAAAAGTTITTPAVTTMKLGHKEDCCQLLQNSPGKFTQHLSSCMQLKMSPTMAVDSSATTMQAGQATTMAKQYYQQRPDVMLMTTGHKLSSQQPATTMAASCRMLLPPPSASTTVAQQQRFYHSNTPAMATYHIVSSASANSSPSHQHSLRHYILPPSLPPPTTTSASCSTASQHFMAVPTNMLRFHQEATLQQQQQQQQLYSNVINATSNVNLNPLALPVSGSATVYFPIVTPATVATQNTSLTAGISQPLIKYHTLQMPHKRQQNIMLLQQSNMQDNQIISNTEDIVDAAAAQFPPPPPPAYQTATVHGIRRAKFLTKPLPQELNTLLHESDISYRHDLSPHLQTFTNASLAAEGGCNGEQQQMPYTALMATTTATTTSITGHTTTSTISEGNVISTEQTIEANETETTNFNSFYAANTNKTNHTATPSALVTTTAAIPPPMATLTSNMKTNSGNTTETSATTTTIYENHESLNREQQLLQDMPDTRHITAVDIMEDEEEHEQQLLGNCPHGTPSRVPLLNSSSSTSDEKSHTRSFLNATAASFHRHTLNPFQRKNIPPQRKSIIINHKGECNLHIPKRRNSSSNPVCYTDPYEDVLTSDDDCDILEGKNMYKLRQLHQTNVQTDNKHLVQDEFYDNHSLVSLAESTAQIPQVPIIVVLFILIFYVSLGTVIFALWENWSLIDGAYFCFVTLTTIGYGDFMPLKTFQGPEIQLFACCAYLLLGLVLVAMAFSILETQLIWKCKRLAVRLKLAKE